MWLVIDAEDRSYCHVHEKNVLQAGTGIKVGDKVKFFYCGEEYNGIVLFITDDYKKGEEEMKRLAKTKNSAPMKRPSLETIPQQLRSRRSQTFGFSEKPAVPAIVPKKKKKSDAPEMTEAEKTRQRVLALNKATSEKLANQMLLSKTTKSAANSDPDWCPVNEDSVDSIVDIDNHKEQLRTTENTLVTSLRKRSPSPTPRDVDTHQASSKSSNENGNPPVSPSKEELMKQILELKKLLGKDTSEGHHQKEKHDKIPNNKKREVESKEDSRKKMNDIEDEDNDDSLRNDNGQDDDSFSEKGTSEGRNSSFSNLKSDDMFVDDLLQAEQNNEMTVDPDKLCDEELSYQLYGKSPDTKELGRNIFCKREVLSQALANAINVNTLVRRLLTGVFIPSKIIDCTVTGQVWRPGSKGKDDVPKPKPLHRGALKAIVDFSNGVAKSKKWKTKKFDSLKSVLATRLIEIKNQQKKNN